MKIVQERIKSEALSGSCGLNDAFYGPEPDWTLALYM